MHSLVPILLLACLMLVWTPAAVAQSSGRATGSASGTVGSQSGVRGAPSGRGSATGVLSGSRSRGVGATIRPPVFGVRVRPPTIRISDYYSLHDPYRYGWTYRDYPSYARRVYPSHGWRGYPRGVIVAGFPFPIVYYYPVSSTHVVHVRSTVATAVPYSAAAQYPAAETWPIAPDAGALPRPPVEACALVTVLQPGSRGYWKELRLPAAGAVNRDELQRFLLARLEERVAFTIRDAAGEPFEVPAAANVERVLVHPCR
jgi:hypothetical protein